MHLETTCSDSRLEVDPPSWLATPVRASDRVLRRPDTTFEIACNFYAVRPVLPIFSIPWCSNFDFSSSGSYTLR